MSDSDTNGLKILRSEQNSEKIAPIVQHGGLEIMHVFVKASDTIWISPADDPKLMEFYYVLDGSIKLYADDETQALSKGDSFYTLALTKDIRVQALGDTEMLYITNEPVYEGVQDFRDMLHKMIDPIDAKDHITLRHSRNVMRYTVKLFDRLGARGLTMDELVTAALFHDAGKCNIPDEILKKTGKLTNEEYAEMKLHPTYTYSVIAPIYGEKVARIASAHHERLDGSGYPDGLQSDQIPYGSRLIAVSDAFDAMTQKRPYNRVKTSEEAVAELRSLTRQYDPEIVDALDALLREGSLTVEDSDADATQV